MAKVSWTSWRCCLEGAEKLDERVGLLGKLDGEGIDGTAGVEKRVVEGRHRPQGDEGLALVEDHAERLVFRGILEVALLRLDHGVVEILAPVSTCLDDGSVALDHGGGGKAEKMRARTEELLEQAAVGVEHRLAAIEIGGGELGFLQQPAALVLAEQVGGLGRRP